MAKKKDKARVVDQKPKEVTKPISSGNKKLDEGIKAFLSKPKPKKNK